MPQQSVNYESMRSKLMTLVDQLRIHYKMDRARVSKTSRELIDHCQQNMQSDPLIYPVKENPFKEKKSCNIL